MTKTNPNWSYDNFSILLLKPTIKSTKESYILLKKKKEQKYKQTLFTSLN